ncbi:hypothetical protein BJV82DRAFT_608069 [Fennellomyces sp. T-0311]|nr:hypothetical protein BJV82DRAFT_608069 [Fennellomyces sp. T-0311]
MPKKALAPPLPGNWLFLVQLFFLALYLSFAFLSFFSWPLLLVFVPFFLFWLALRVMAENMFEFPQIKGEPSTGGNLARRYLPIRKNACIVCSICFTCSKYYAEDCTCDESQPRRGKNLPDGTLDSRAKKLHPQDNDYEFSIKWLTEHAHVIHRDEHGQVTGLRELPEVSLCKAHSSTLYRAQKKHERVKQLPPPPFSNNATSSTFSPSPDYLMDIDLQHRPPIEQQPQQSQPPPYYQHQQPYQPMSNLAAKVRNIHHQPFQGEMPDFSTMSSSTSLKRKRTESMARSSASTPLLAHPYHSPSSPIPHVDFNQQLPPLHQQQQQPQPQASPRAHPQGASLSSLPLRRVPPPPPGASSSVPTEEVASSSRRMSFPHYPPPSTPYSTTSSPSLEPAGIVVDTVSLKTTINSSSPEYLIKNLAITDTFTFRDLLMEAGVTESPPPGKRIVISDDKQERIFPLDQAIRSVLRRPIMAHLEFWLSLHDKPSIDWSSYTA